MFNFHEDQALQIGHVCWIEQNTRRTFRNTTSFYIVIYEWVVSWWVEDWDLGVSRHMPYKENMYIILYCSLILLMLCIFSWRGAFKYTASTIVALYSDALDYSTEFDVCRTYINQYSPLAQHNYCSKNGAKSLRAQSRIQPLSETTGSVFHCFACH